MSVFSALSKRHSGTKSSAHASGLRGLGKLLADGMTAFKDFGVTAQSDYGWNNVMGGSGSMRFPGSDLDWNAEAGTPWYNACVSICLQYIWDKISEPHVKVVYEDDEGLLQPVLKHPASQLLKNPNPEYRGDTLLDALALSYSIDGNAYAVKVRNKTKTGPPKELWWVPHWRMESVPPENGGPTEVYKLTTPTANGGVNVKLYSRADVIHIKNGIDPNNPRKGFSKVKAQLRSIVSANEIDAYTAVILRNMGVFGAVVSPASTGDAFEDGQAPELKRLLNNNNRGDNRASITVSDIPIKIDHTSRSPQDLGIKDMGDHPRAAICAAFGIDPSVVLYGQSGGGKGEKYGSARKESRESSYEQAILPLLSRFAEAWTYELLPDFGVDPDVFWIEYDYSRVRDLQPDLDAMHLRLQGDFTANGITLDEFRQGLGYKECADPELGEKFQFQLLPGPGGEYGVKPAPNDPVNPKGTKAPDDPDNEDLPEDDEESDDD